MSQLRDIYARLQELEDEREELNRTPEGSKAEETAVMERLDTIDAEYAELREKARKLRQERKKHHTVEEFMRRYRDRTEWTGVGFYRVWPGVAEVLTDLRPDPTAPFVHVAGIIVPEEYRRTGAGTRTLKEILALADTTGVSLTLSPQPTGPGRRIPVRRLKEWYRKFGFIGEDRMTRPPNIRRGRKRNPGSSADLVRRLKF